MRFRVSLLSIVLLLVAGPLSVDAQPTVRHVDLEVEPLSYAFGGAGGHMGLQVHRWKYEVEVFTLDIPESLHGNDGFTASPLGVEFHAERTFGDHADGFYVGPEVGVVRLELTHRPSGRTERHTRFSAGVRGGYTWYPGLGNLYISPVVGISYTLNGAPIDMAGETFESAPFGAWGTVGLGWSFSR